MTTAFPEKANCPLCGAPVTVNIVGSTNQFGQDSDLRPRRMGMDPLHIAVGHCPDCGYVDYSERFVNAQQPMTADIQSRIRAVIAPRPVGGGLATGASYATMAKIAGIRGESSSRVANLYLRAAWCSADSRRIEEEKHYRQQAIAHFESALVDGAVEEQQRPFITYLVGELYRRTGDQERATEWFNKVIALSEDDPELGRVRELARRQRDEPRDTL